MDQSTNDTNVKQESNVARLGLDQDSSINQVARGKLLYALNAAVENYDANGVSYQNEMGNELCIFFPDGFMMIGKHFIAERNKHIFFMTNPETGDSHIGYMENNDCVYHVLVNSPCLNFSIDHPIHKVVSKITNCTTEIYWTDGYNPRRYMDIDNIPRILKSGSPLCSPVYSDDLDCNQLKVQPNFPIPQLEIADVVNIGNLISGTYQFAIQYSDSGGNPYTSYYSITNPVPIADIHITTPNFNYPVGKSIIVNVSNLDSTGHFQYFNLAVIKTINNIASAELVGTYFIDESQKKVTYTGQNVTAIRLSMEDVFEKHPYYDIADDVTAVQDVLVWDQLTSVDRINYQEIASKIDLGWETWRIPPTEDYSNEENAANLRGYLRDEVYAFEIVFLLRNGKQTDGFHIPGRQKNINEFGKPDVADINPDFIGAPAYMVGNVGYSPYWQIYNTASVTGYSPEYDATDPNYKGPYQYGEFGYWESTEEYSCSESLWGDLAGQKIRHHKFPDVLVSPIFESKVFTDPASMLMGDDAVFPIGVRVDIQQVSSLINTSSLTKEQKDDIVGFKIVRGDRSTNQSIVAKGILRNVGAYEREGNEYFYPNYPYNDLRADPFLNSTNNAYESLCITYHIDITALDNGYASVQYTDCANNRTKTELRTELGAFLLCSTTKPVILLPADGEVSIEDYEIWLVTSAGGPLADVTVQWTDPVLGYTQDEFHSRFINVVPNTGTPRIVSGSGSMVHTSDHTSGLPSINCGETTALSSFTDTYRQVFNSPETSFGQPFLGNILKLENVIFGKGKAHFTEVKDNAKYRLITEDAQRKALDSSNTLGLVTGTGDKFGVSAMFAAYQSYLTIYANSITRRNFAYSFNSIADYNYAAPIPNDMGVKQRNLDIARYIIPAVQSVDDIHSINNYQRESSVYLKTDDDISSLPFPDKTPNLTPGGSSIITEYSRFTISEVGHCNTPAQEEDIRVVSYYASIKNQVLDQWGQIYSYETIDTGFQRLVDSSVRQTATVFGGDTFIGRFAFKTKLPFFIDNRVGAPDDSDIFYDEIGNVAYPKYWHSSRSILKDYMSSGGLLSNIISYKAHNFDCPNEGIVAVPVNPDVLSTSTTTTTTMPVPPPIEVQATQMSDTITYYDGYFYLFAYGVPYFYCESSYNLDLRQAYNNREGDFFPHVTNDIPDDWVQEHFVSIANDNTYYYNVTYSKQNKENSFSHLPPDWEDKLCYTRFPFRAIYSEPQQSEATSRVNNWLTYAPVSYFDFPQNYGSLTSLDGIQNKAILARFENKSLLYDRLLSLDTSYPQMAYLGNPGMFKNPPIDFAETDLGYVGSQHKMLLKIPQGQVTIDAKRGQIFLISGTQLTELSGFGSGMNRFFTDHLAFEILRYFPDIEIDNHYKDIGLHGVYDSKFDRLIITKLDYIPTIDNIVYDDGKFYLEEIVNNATLRKQVYLTEQDYFCNKSWTISYNMNTHSWISFHSYIPNFYIAENNFFYSGINGCCDDFDVIAGELVPESTTTTTTLCAIDVVILDEFPTTTTTTTGELTTTTTSTTESITTTTTTTEEATTTTTTTSP